MTRLSLFNSPLLLGFDHIERTLEALSKGAGDGYPPYNIEQIGEDALRITLAVAGFSADRLNVDIEANRLTIAGRQPDDVDDRVFLHRGIAARQFQRHFLLAEGIEVTAARLDSGLLHVDLVRRAAERPTRRIPIEPAGHGQRPQGR